MSKATDKQVGGNHYKDYKIQPYEFFVANNIPFHKADIIKRILRYDHPTGKGREDLEKIKHEIELILELDEMFKIETDKDEFYKNSDIEYDPDAIIAGEIPSNNEKTRMFNGVRYTFTCREDCTSYITEVDELTKILRCKKCKAPLV